MSIYQQVPHPLHLYGAERQSFPIGCFFGTSTAADTANITANTKGTISAITWANFPGEIIRVHLQAGLYDVAFDDGQIELNVRRKRIG